jgi:hypothetical protein
LIAKVTAIAAMLWLIKILSTTVGKTFADYLSTTFAGGLGLSDCTAFTADELQAMGGRTKGPKNGGSKIAAEDEVILEINEMDASAKFMAQKVQGLVKIHSPDLDANTWYGMPAY